MRITRDEFPILAGAKKPDKQELNKNSEKTMPDSEIKKQLTILVDETMKQLSNENKNEQDLEDIYLIFKGQMMVINKCRLLSVKEQQEQNAQVYACYYQRKFEFKKQVLQKKKQQESET